MGGAAPNTPARGFQIPRTPFIGFQGPPVVEIETPRWSFFLAWRRPANFCPARDPFIRAWHGPCGTMAGNPGGLVGPPPPSATSPGRRVALSSTFLKHPKRVCTWYRPSFCPDYGGSGDGGGETRLRPAPLDMDFAGPSLPAWTGPAAPGLSIRAAGEFAVWVAKREGPRKLERRDPARGPGER